MSRVLAIGDIHAPVTHPGYFDFCCDVKKKYRCDKVVFIGDVVDWHGISFHAKHPDAPGPKDEYLLALREVQRWYRKFKNAVVTIGNHDERLIRLAESAGVPGSFIRDYKDVWKTPKWDWVFDTIIDNVYYYHGTGRGGMHPAFNTAKDMTMSVVMGHCHSAGGIKWLASPTQRRFGMDTGCGIDDQMYAFSYGKHMKRKSVLSCGVVLDGIGQHVIMPCSDGEKYSRENYPPSPLLRT